MLMARRKDGVAKSIEEKKRDGLCVQMVFEFLKCRNVKYSSF